MIGVPRHLNTKEDYEYIRANFPSSVWEPKFQVMLDELKVWMNNGEITNGGITDATHKVVEDTFGETSRKYQYELKENPNCLMYRIGYTVAEVEAILNDK